MSTTTDVQIIDVPARRRKQNRFNEQELAGFAAAVPGLTGTKAVLVGQANVQNGDLKAAENDARTIARDAQRELHTAHGLETRTSVFRRGDAYLAALRQKSGTTAGPAMRVDSDARTALADADANAGAAQEGAAGDDTQTPAGGWTADMVRESA